MTFKQIVIFTMKEFNGNKEKDGRFPQEGSVINVFVSSIGMNSVAVGYAK